MPHWPQKDSPQRTEQGEGHGEITGRGDGIWHLPGTQQVLWKSQGGLRDSISWSSTLFPWLTPPGMLCLPSLTLLSRSSAPHYTMSMPEPSHQ